MNHGSRNGGIAMGTSRCIWTIAALAASVFIMAGCAKTNLKSVWQDPEFAGAGFSSYLVIALDGKTGDRMLLENEFVKRLRAKNVTAVPSYRLLPPTGPVNKEVILKAIEGRDTNAVLIVRLSGARKAKDASSRMPGARVGPGTHGFVDSEYGWYQPGYDYAIYEVEASVWEITTPKRVWSAKTDFLDPKRPDFLKNISEYSRMIVDEMKKGAMF